MVEKFDFLSLSTHQDELVFFLLLFHFLSDAFVDFAISIVD